MTRQEPMTSMLKVRPAKGQEFPLESAAGRRRFTGPRAVPDSEFYRRAIAKGDLVVMSDTEFAAAVGKDGPAPAAPPSVAPVAPEGMSHVLLDRASKARRRARVRKES